MIALHNYSFRAAPTFILPGAVFLAGLFIPTNTFAEWDDWIADAYLGVEQVENISHALSGTPYTEEEKNDTLINPRAVFGRIFQITDYTRMIFTARLEGVSHQEYSLLNSTTVGGSAVLHHKFGYGPATPWLRANVDLGLMDTGDDMRDSNLVNAGLRTGMRFLPWLDGWMAYEYFQRDGGEGETLPPGYSGIIYTPSVGTDVYDLTRNTFRINLNAHPMQDVSVSLGYSLSDGDFTAACSDASFAWLTQYETSYKAVAIDEAFQDAAGTNFCIYRVAATAATASLGASYGLSRRSSVNLGYQQQTAKAKVYKYETTIYRLNYMHIF